MQTAFCTPFDELTSPMVPGQKALTIRGQYALSYSFVKDVGPPAATNLKFTVSHN